MFKKILVPLDSSNLAEQALPTAVRLAQSSQGSITLLHVLEHNSVLIPEGPDLLGHNLHTPQSIYSLAEVAAREYLNQMEYGVARENPGINWHMRLEEGDPASLIVDVAAEEAVDLIVMSTHGYSGFTRWMLGSVTEKVIRHVSCPVLVVKDDTPIQEVLITLDGSALSESCLPFGIEVAVSCGAVVTLLRVDDTTDDINLDEIEDLNRHEAGLGEQFQQNLQQEVVDYLERISADYRRSKVPLQTAVRYGKAAQTIINFAEEKGIDLIVMSTHGRTGLARWRYGSITEKVLHGAACAMLIYRPEEMNA